jgi:hypothetical protein
MCLKILPYWPRRQPRLGRPINLGDLSLKADGFRATFGYHKNVSDKLVLGARAKFIPALLMRHPQKIRIHLDNNNIL